LSRGKESKLIEEPAPKNASQHRPDFELEKGVLLDFKFGKDENGFPVIADMHFYFENDRTIPQGGITASTLREVVFERILKKHFKEESSLYYLSTSDRKKLLKFLKNGMDFSGRTGFPKEFYAALAYFYIETFEKFPKEPTAKLVEILDVPKRTLINRLAMARKLNLLTQQSAERPSGKAGGALTEEALELINDYLNN